MRTYTLVFSVAAHVAVACAVLFSIVLATDELPEPRRASVFIEVFSAPLPSAPPPSRPRVADAMTHPDAAPVDAPSGVRPEPADPPLDFDRAGAPSGSVVFDGGGGDPIGRDQPPPPSNVAPTPPVRVGGVVRPPTKTVHVAPAYPPVARAARVSGVVILEATIGEDGRVRDVRVLRSIPLLDEAATDAVRRWRFTPTLLNGQAVPVLMTVSVSFTLD